MSDTQPKVAIRTMSTPLNCKYTVMFDKDVEAPSEHQEELYMMRQAEEGDLVEMYINTDGGRVATVSAAHGIITKSSATFHAILEGDASSAGSMLFLMADTQEVYPLGSMYIHTTQSGMGGHSQEMKSYGKYSGEFAEKLVRTVYKDFLTEEEILKVLDGGVLWFQSEEICERLGKRDQIRNQKAIEETKETYTPEVYAKQCVSDITEDCEVFGYDPVEVIKEMLEQAFENQEARSCGCGSVKEEDEKEESTFTEEELDSNICWDGESVFIEKAPYRLETATRDDLVWIASELEVSHAWNISEAKLRQRILDFLNEED